MPQSRRNKARRSRPAQAKRPEMFGNERDLKSFGLSTRQQGALTIIAAAPTVAQAARDAHISEATIRRWKKDPTFSEQLDLLRSELAEEATKQSLGLILDGMTVLAEAMRDPDQTLRVRAARYALVYGVQIHESRKVHAQIDDLQTALENLESRVSAH